MNSTHSLAERYAIARAVWPELPENATNNIHAAYGAILQVSEVLAGFPPAHTKPRDVKRILDLGARVAAERDAIDATPAKG